MEGLVACPQSNSAHHSRQPEKPQQHLDGLVAMQQFPQR